MPLFDFKEYLESIPLKKKKKTVIISNQFFLYIIKRGVVLLVDNMNAVLELIPLLPQFHDDITSRHNSMEYSSILLSIFYLIFNYTHLRPMSK